MRAWLVGDEMVRSAADKRQVAGCQFQEVAVAVRPEPGAALDHRMNGKLDGPGEPEPPRRDRDGPGEDSSRRARPDQMLLKNVHTMSVLRKIVSVKHIETLTMVHDPEHMNNTANRHVLVLGATGKTGSRESTAAATLADPGRHAGRAYAPTGPQSLTLGEAAQIISAAAGRTIVYRDTDRDEWVNAMIRSGVPADYGEALRTLTETIADGHGSRPNGDVLAATGAAPISFADFAAKTAPAWKQASP